MHLIQACTVLLLVSSVQIGKSDAQILSYFLAQLSDLLHRGLSGNATATPSPSPQLINIDQARFIQAGAIPPAGIDSNSLVNAIPVATRDPAIKPGRRPSAEAESGAPPPKPPQTIPKPKDSRKPTKKHRTPAPITDAAAVSFEGEDAVQTSKPRGEKLKTTTEQPFQQEETSTLKARSQKLKTTTEQPGQEQTTTMKAKGQKLKTTTEQPLQEETTQAPDENEEIEKSTTKKRKHSNAKQSSATSPKPESTTKPTVSSSSTTTPPTTAKITTTTEDEPTTTEELQPEEEEKRSSGSAEKPNKKLKHTVEAINARAVKLLAANGQLRPRVKSEEEKKRSEEESGEVFEETRARKAARRLSTK